MSSIDNDNVDGSTTQEQGGIIKRCWAKLERFFDYPSKWLEESRGNIMVVATVIVQIAFGLHSQPPGGVWSETKENQPDQCPITNGVCHVGTSVMAASTENNRLIYLSFRSYNSTALIGSMCVILMLISGIPLENKPFTWALIVTVCITLASLTSAFVRIAMMMTPVSTDGSDADRYIKDLESVNKAATVWSYILYVVCAFYAIRFVIWLVKIISRILTCCGCNDEDSKTLI